MEPIKTITKLQCLVKTKACFSLMWFIHCSTSPLPETQTDSWPFTSWNTAVAGGKTVVSHHLVSVPLEVTHANSTGMSVTKTSQTVTSNFKAVGKWNLTLCLEGGEWTYLWAGLVTTTKHWQELAEMDTRRHSGSSADQHGFPEKQIVKMCLKVLKGSSSSSSWNLLLGSREVNKDYEHRGMLKHPLHIQTNKIQITGLSISR